MHVQWRLSKNGWPSSERRLPFEKETQTDRMHIDAKMMESFAMLTKANVEKVYTHTHTIKTATHIEHIFGPMSIIYARCDFLQMLDYILCRIYFFCVE